MIFVFLINFAVHSFSHQAQPELRRVLIERVTTAGRNATPSIPSAFTFGNTFRMMRHFDSLLKGAISLHGKRTDYFTRVCLHDMAERVGFEPTVHCCIISFQDWRLKPLGHLSVFWWILSDLN